MIGPSHQLDGDIDFANPINWSNPVNRGLLWWSLALPNLFGSQWHNLAWRAFGDLRSAPLTNMAPAADWQRTSRKGGFAALDFDGSDDYLPTGLTKNLAGNGYAVSCYAKPRTRLAGVVPRRLATKRGTGGFEFELMLLDTGDLRFQVFDGTTTSNLEASIALGVWTHILATVDGGGTQRLYLDGQQSGTTPAVSGGSTNEIDIGRGNTKYYDGLLDDFAVWDRGIRPAEAQAIYDNSRRGYPGRLNRINQASEYRRAPFVLGYGDTGTSGFPKSRIIGGV